MFLIDLEDIPNMKIIWLYLTTNMNFLIILNSLKCKIQGLHIYIALLIELHTYNILTRIQMYLKYVLSKTTLNMYQYTKIHTKVKILRLVVVFYSLKVDLITTLYPVIFISSNFPFVRTSLYLISFCWLLSSPLPIATCNQLPRIIKKLFTTHWMTKNHLSVVFSRVIPVFYEC